MMQASSSLSPVKVVNECGFKVNNFMVVDKPKKLLLDSPVIFSKFNFVDYHDHDDQLIESFLTTAVKSPPQKIKSNSHSGVSD